MSEEEKDEETSEEVVSGAGLDIGTMNIVSARKIGGSIETKRMRDAFLDLDASAKKMLKLSGVSYIEYEDDEILILGDPAIETANIFNREVRRPLSKGLISSEEIDAFEVLSILIKSVLGEPKKEGETCCFSVPANPLDMDRDNTFHQSVFERILGELGYDPVGVNEALAIIYSECAEHQFSGIGISCGAGMVNVAMAYRTIPAFQFALARGGDWIDEQAAKAVNATASRMCTFKEENADLSNPNGREGEALAVYYKSMIDYALDNIEEEFKKKQDNVNLPDEVPIVVSGGTSMADGFIDFFREVFDERRDDFPVDVGDIVHAEDPMTTVAKGLLVQAMQEEEEE